MNHDSRRRVEGIETGDASPFNVSSVSRDDREVVDLRRRGEKAIDHGKGMRNVQAPPFLCDRLSDRQDSGGMIGH